MNRHQFEYKRAMDSIHATREWEDYMVAKLMENGKTKKTRRAPRIGLIAAAAAACLTIGAGAAEAATGAVSDLFAPLFGTTHTEVIDSIGYPVGASDSSGGVTVTAEAIIGDANNVCVLFSLTRDDGSSWELPPDIGYLSFEESDLDLGMVGSHGSSWFLSGSGEFLAEGSDDKTLRYVEQRTVDEGIPRGSSKATLKNLCVWNEETESMETLAKGKWTLRFDLDFQDTTRNYPAGQTVEFLGEPATVTGITFSPIAFRVELEQNRTEYAVQDSYRYLDGQTEALDALSVVLKLKDGREIDLGYWAGGSVTPGDGKTSFVKSNLFDEVILPEEMESVTVCGVEIPLQ